LLGSVRIAFLDGRQDAGDIAHVGKFIAPKATRLLRRRSNETSGQRVKKARIAIWHQLANWLIT
jgi:hypothetical protein